MKAIDFHVHQRTGDRVQGGEQWRQARQLFKVGEESVDLVEYYASRDMRAVVFDVDAETTDGMRACNDSIAELAERSEGVLIGFATVDPWKGKAALDELDRCREMGLRGLKIQPVTQQLRLNERRFSPLWEYCQAHQLPVLVHTGTTGIGAGSPGGGGYKLDYGRPVPYLDDVASEFPDLTLIAAHFGWPWYLEALAVARHKSNVYIDLSGWSPKYFPAEVVKYFQSVIPDKFLFGSDFPLLTPDRWLAEFDELGTKASSREAILYGNACRVLGLDVPTEVR